MASTLQAAQTLVQVNNALTPAGGSDGGLAAWSKIVADPLSVCRDPEHDESSSDDDRLGAPAPAGQVTKFKLRLCVYSGSNLPRAATFVAIDINDEEKQRSEPAQESAFPVWEFPFECPLEFDGSPPEVEIKIYGSGLGPMYLGNKQIGAAHVRLPSTSTNGPKQLTPKVKLQPSVFSSLTAPAKEPELLVIMQLQSETETDCLDLVRVAEMGPRALNQTTWFVSVRVVNLLMKFSTSQEVDASATLKLKKRNGTTEKLEGPNATSKERLKECPKLQSSKAHYNFATWEDSTMNTVSWKDIRETRVNLLGYKLQLEVSFSSAQEEQPSEFPNPSESRKSLQSPTVFEESLGDIMDLIDDINTVLRFDCQVTQPDGTCRCWVRLEVDVHNGLPHHRPRPMQKEAAPPLRGRLNEPDHTVPVRLGLKAGRNAKSTLYFCTLWATGVMVDKGSKLTVRITTSLTQGEKSTDLTSTPVTAQGDMFDMWCTQQVAVKMKDNDRKCKVELYSRSGGLFGGRDEVLGEAMIYDVEVDTPLFLPLFGGALGGPSNMADIGLQMVKGAKQHPSTYHGTVAVLFSKTPRVPDVGILNEIRTHRIRYSLKVKLWRGLYFKALAGETVRVLVQIPGSFLRVPEAPKEDHARGWDLNRNLLSFPGRVDKDGVLRFTKAMHLDWKSTFSKAEEPNLSWVQRGTEPVMNALIRVEEVVRHAYVYIVAVGDEDQAPQIFGRIRMQKKTNDNKADAEVGVPRWKRMRWDASVVEIGKDKFSNDFAGFILGSAWLTPITDEDDTEVPSPKAVKDDSNIATATSPNAVVIERLSPIKPRSVLCRPVYCPLTGSTYHNFAPELQLNPDQYEIEKSDLTWCYCHLDVLTARSLWPMDENGLADPRYEIWCENRCHLVDGPAPASLNPTFNARLVVPFRVDIPVDDQIHIPSGMMLLPESGTSVPLPPVVFLLKDQDGDSYQTMGLVAVKHPGILTGSERELDLNKDHKAVWYDLKEPTYTDFDATKAGGVDPMWRTRPRVLLSAAFSLNDAVANFQYTFVGEEVEQQHKAIRLGQISTEDAKLININIDLLGLRNLPPDTVGNTSLNVYSFWPYFPENGSIVIPSESNPNFSEAELANKMRYFADMKEFSDTVAPIFRIRLADAKESFKTVAPEADSDSDSQASSVATDVDLETVCGVRLEAPPYRAPVIQYLQPPADKLQLHERRNSFVLYPDITFDIQDRSSGVNHGSLSTTLPFERATQDGYEKIDMSGKTWLRQSALEMKTRKEGVLPQPFNMATVMEGSYSVHVDVFAAKPGWMMWDQDVHTGAMLNDHRLFTVADAEESESSEGESGSDDDDEQKKKKMVSKRNIWSQLFNPFDWMLEDKTCRGRAFANTASPTLYCGKLAESLDNLDVGAMWKKGTRENMSPKGPDELFAGPLAKVTMKLETNRTGAIKQKCEEIAYRATTHLAAPTKMDSSDPDKHLDECNTHCFMRPVGHCVQDADRDSKVLARLRMGVPHRVIAELQDHASKKTQQTYLDLQRLCNNYVVFKFLKPAVVVWAPPADKFYFSVPGETLFVLMLTDGTRSHLMVKVPSFDMRFKFESAWRVKKSLTSRFRTLENEIKNQAKKRTERMSRRDTAHKTPNRDDDEETDKEPSQEDVVDASLKHEGSINKNKKVPPDGYSQPIQVPQNAFIVRLERFNGLCYDREQTSSWYRTILSETIPEVHELKVSPEDDSTMVREFFLSRFMNLRRTLSAGTEAHQGAHGALLKGHITMHEESAPKLAIASKAEEPAPSKSAYQLARATLRRRHENKAQNHEILRKSKPVENMWREEALDVVIYVLTVRDVKLPPSAGTFDPVLKVFFNDEKRSHQVKGDRPPGNTVLNTSLNIYKQFSFKAPVPGSSTLRLELIDDNGLFRGGLLVGYVEVDVEDRWFAMVSRQFRAMSNQEFVKSNASPAEVFHIDGSEIAKSKMNQGLRKWQGTKNKATGGVVKVAKNDNSIRLKPHLPPPAPIPIEGAPIWRADEDTGEDVQVGTLRFWMDLMPQKAPKTMPNFAAVVPDAFVVFVTIKKIEKISIFKDVGERNDIQVRGKLRMVDMLGNSTLMHEGTDVAKYSRYDAHFNWRWKFDVKVPCQLCMISLAMYDVDNITRDDPIYSPKDVSLDHFLGLAHANYLEGRPCLGMKTEVVVFDAWSKKHQKGVKKAREARRTTFVFWYACCVWCVGHGFGFVKRMLLPRAPKPNPCFMTVELQIVPKVEADLMSMDLQQISPPQNRIGKWEMIENPFRAAFVLLGPQNIRILLLSALGLTVALGIVVILFILYLLSPFLI